MEQHWCDILHKRVPRAGVGLRGMRLLEIRGVGGIRLELICERGEKCDSVWVREERGVSGRRSWRECPEMVINMYACVCVLEGKSTYVCG